MVNASAIENCSISKDYKNLSTTSLSWQLAAVPKPGRCPRAGWFVISEGHWLSSSGARHDQLCLYYSFVMFNSSLKKRVSSLTEEMPASPQTSYSFALLCLVVRKYFLIANLNFPFYLSTATDMRNKLFFFTAATEYIWRFIKHYVSVLFFLRLNSCILSALSLHDVFSQISDHSFSHSLDSFHLSMFFLTLLSTPSTPVLSWMQKTFNLLKATFLFVVVRCLPLEQCHELLTHIQFVNH